MAWNKINQRDEHFRKKKIENGFIFAFVWLVLSFSLVLNAYTSCFTVQQKLKKLPQLEQSETEVDPDGKIRTSGARAISQSNSRIRDSGPLRSWKKYLKMLSSHLGYRFHQFVTTRYTTKFYVIKFNTNSTFYSLADPLVLGVMLILGLPTAFVPSYTKVRIKSSILLQ